MSDKIIITRIPGKRLGDRHRVGNQVLVFENHTAGQDEKGRPISRETADIARQFPAYFTVTVIVESGGKTESGRGTLPAGGEAGQTPGSGSESDLGGIDTDAGIKSAPAVKDAEPDSDDSGDGRKKGGKGKGRGAK